MVLFLTGIDPCSFSSPPIHVFLGSNYISCQPLLAESSPSIHHWFRGLSGSYQQHCSAFSSHYLPPQWITRTLRSVSQAIYRGSWTLSPPWKFFSWCILCVRINSHHVVNKYTALLLVLSTVCATFYKRSLYSAPNSVESCALFHWILSHFFTLILRVTQSCISSFCVFMNPLNLASLAKFYQHTPNFCTKTINRNTK